MERTVIYILKKMAHKKIGFQTMKQTLQVKIIGIQKILVMKLFLPERSSDKIVNILKTPFVIIEWVFSDYIVI